RLSEQVQAQTIRLTMHLEQHIALGSHQAAVVSQSLAAIETRAALLERLGMQAEGSLIVHIGGPSSTPESRRASLRLFAQHYTSLSACARARLAVEHDTSGFSLGDLLELHQQCGVAVVFDYLHWRLYNPENLPLALALGLAVATWQPGVRPEVHLSTARSEAHLQRVAGSCTLPRTARRLCCRSRLAAPAGSRTRSATLRYYARIKSR
ncbi:MAG: hypothetical protein HC828_15430, partial [Blastochloris sp.]|nr:hypothetical protein [Blastochloris sp.]